MIGAASSAGVAGVGAGRAGDAASPVALSIAAISAVPGEKSEDVSNSGKTLWLAEDGLRLEAGLGA